MTSLEQINEIERSCRYLLQQASRAKNALTSLEAMQGVKEFHSPDILALAEKNAKRQDGFLVTAAAIAVEELTKLVPDSAPAATGGKE